MNGLDYRFNADAMQEMREKLRGPWRAFFFLFVVFAFATPYEFDFTLQRKNLDEMVESADEGSLGRKVAVPMLAGYGILCLINPRSKRIRLNGLLGLSFAFFLVLAFTSLFWAEDQVLAARKLTVYGLLMISAIGLAARFTFRDIALFVSFICLGEMALSLGTEIMLGTFLKAPPYAIYQFSGVMHPNATATYCAIGAISTFALANMELHKRKIYLLLTFLSLVFLSMTKSRTAFGAAIVVLFFFWACTTGLKQKFAALVGAGALCCLLGLVFSDDLQNQLAGVFLLGREEEGTAGSLSNRLPLWQECLSYVEKRPLLGYGYDTFWTPRHIYTISKHQGWEVPHSHNGYLEMTLSLGLIGLFLYMIVLVAYLKTALTRWCLLQNPVALYGFFIIVWLCLEMTMEKVYMFPVFPSFVCNLIIVRFAFVEAEEDLLPPTHWQITLEKLPAVL